MDTKTFITVVFCLVDDFLRDLCRRRRLSQREPEPVLADSEVLTIEIVGEFLGLETDRGLHAHFRRHFGHLFPGMRGGHRTTRARQAANLWAVKSALWHQRTATAQHDSTLVLIDAYRCRLPLRPRLPLPALPGLATFGYDAPPPTCLLARHDHCGHTCAR